MFRQIGLARRFRSETEMVLKLDPTHVEARFGIMVHYFKAPGIIGGDRKKAYLEAEEIGKIYRAKGFVAQAELAEEANELWPYGSRLTVQTVLARGQAELRAERSIEVGQVAEAGLQRDVEHPASP